MTTATRVAQASFTRESLPDRVPNEQRYHDDGGQAGGEREQRQRQPEVCLSPAHPFALSTMKIVNGFCPGGTISNDRPQCPTITSAGAAWP